MFPVFRANTCVIFRRCQRQRESNILPCRCSLLQSRGMVNLWKWLGSQEQPLYSQIDISKNNKNLCVTPKTMSLISTTWCQGAGHTRLDSVITEGGQWKSIVLEGESEEDKGNQPNIDSSHLICLAKANMILYTFTSYYANTNAAVPLLISSLFVSGMNLFLSFHLRWKAEKD